jgi:hypothetical protein
MGVDYFRFRLKPNADREVIESLVRRQSVAFQSMWGWHSAACSDVNALWRALAEELHLESYLTASRRLRNHIELPECDENGCAKDISDLAPCWRVSPIAGNPAFPPLWRMRAYRTILPDELQSQVAEWRTWAQEVVAGKHDDYLRRIHMHATSDFLRYHWSYLRGHASASQHKTTKWTSKPELHTIRHDILSLPEPQVFKAPVDVSARDEPFDDVRYADLLAQVRRLIALTRSWNRNVPRSWKVPDYTSNYDLTLDELKNKALDDWLTDFLAWADRCSENGFGFFLDY